MRGKCLLKNKDENWRKKFCKFRSILTTFSIDENFKKVSGHESQKEKKIQITIQGN
jgi:hypothetical protein